MTERKDTQAEIYSPDVFIDKLYDSVKTWLIDEKKAEVVKEFKDSKVINWETYSDYPPRDVTLSAQIKKAILLENPKNIYGLVLSDRMRSRYQRKSSLGVEFGYFPKGRRFKIVTARFDNQSGVEALRSLVHQSYLTCGSGEFFVDGPFSSINVNCWADGWRYGGKGVGRWPKEELQTEKGIQACIDVVKRLEKNAFVGL